MTSTMVSSLRVTPSKYCTRSIGTRLNPEPGFPIRTMTLRTTLAFALRPEPFEPSVCVSTQVTSVEDALNKHTLSPP